MNRTLSIILLAICSISPMVAQELPEKDKLALQERTKQKVEEFQGYTSNIANGNLSYERRRSSIESAMELFIGKGAPYTLTQEVVNKKTGEVKNIDKTKSGVKMQVSSVNRSWISSKPMREYLNALYRQSIKYADVRIESSDVVRVDNLHKVAEGRYEAMAYYCQRYARYDDRGLLTYGDVSRKKIKVYVTAKEIPFVGTIYEVQLGDVYVVSTKRLWE